MPFIEDPPTLAFIRNRVRTAATVLSRAYYATKAVLLEAEARGIPAKIPDDPSYVVKDGAPQNGWPPITGAHVHRILEALKEIEAAMERLASNGEPHYKNAIRVSPDPSPRMRVDIT